MPEDRPPIGTVEGGVYKPADEVNYVWRRGEGPDTPPEEYTTQKNGIKVKRVSATAVTEKGEQESNKVLNILLPAAFMKNISWYTNSI